MNKEAPKVKEVSVLSDEGKEKSLHYISNTLIMCTGAVVLLIIFVLIVQFVIGWGPIFNKLFAMMGIS